jgi:peptidyl-prolyl cis-trans isomerase SurA
MKMHFSAAIKHGVMTLKCGAATLALAAIGLSAQTVRDDRSVPNVGLNLPSTVSQIGANGPTIRKATAIVNGDVITGTDVDQRLALIIFANGGNIPAEERDRLRVQVLSNIIDETLQIQEAKANDVEISKAELDQAFATFASRSKRKPDQMKEFLKTAGSSDRSLRRQIEGELAWSRLLNRRVAPNINVSDDEVKSVIDRLNAAKGSTEYRVGEIFLSSTPENFQEVSTNATRILEQLRSGGSFAAYARQFSESSTGIVGGDLGWIRPKQLPDELGLAIVDMKVGQVAGPISVSGGVSILYLIDNRQVLAADPRDAVLSLRQVSISFPAGTPAADFQKRSETFSNAVKSMQGCGGAEAIAKQFGGDVVDNEQITIRDLPAQLQTLMLQLQVGQATPAFGSQTDGVRTLIVCGRDEPQVAGAPSEDAIENKLRDERINRRAQIYLRDLRRDAIIDYR